jgi:ZIP family zinc transporter
MSNIQSTFETQLTTLKSTEYYLKLKAMPSVQCWLIVGGLFLISQILVFGLLYLIFGKIVVIGFLASILAGLATGVGALPALFFKEISDQLFNSLLGAAAGVMLAATAFSFRISSWY